MIKLINGAVGFLQSRFMETIALVLARLALAGIFWRSAQTKIVDGNLFNIDPTTFFLFEEEYGMPFPEITGTIATYAEYSLPILLVFGLFSRFAATGLFIMTMTIQLFVYTSSADWWQTHSLWAGLALFIMVRGGGWFSLDRLIAGRAGLRQDF